MNNYIDNECINFEGKCTNISKMSNIYKKESNK